MAQRRRACAAGVRVCVLKRPRTALCTRGAICRGGSTCRAVAAGCPRRLVRVIVSRARFAYRLLGEVLIPAFAARQAKGCYIWQAKGCYCSTPPSPPCSTLLSIVAILNHLGRVCVCRV